MFMFLQLYFSVNFLWTKHLVKNSHAQHVIYSSCEEREVLSFPLVHVCGSWRLKHLPSITQRRGAFRPRRADPRPCTLNHWPRRPCCSASGTAPVCRRLRITSDRRLIPILTIVASSPGVCNRPTCAPTSVFTCVLQLRNKSPRSL